MGFKVVWLGLGVHSPIKVQGNDSLASSCTHDQLSETSSAWVGLLDCSGQHHCSEWGQPGRCALTMRIWWDTHLMLLLLLWTL